MRPSPADSALGTSSICTAHVQRTPRRRAQPGAKGCSALPKHISSPHFLRGTCCPLCILGGSWDEEVKGQGWELTPGAAGSGASATADLCLGHFFPWQWDISLPPTPGSIQQHPHFCSLQISPVALATKTAGIPREINGMVCRYCQSQ